MELDRYVTGLRDDLLAAAALGDDETRRAATLLATTLEPAARLMLMSALSDLAAEVSTQLDDWTVDVTIRGRNIDVSVRDLDEHSPDWTDIAAEPDETDSDDEADLGRAVREAGDELSRTTLRLMNKLKAQAERVAGAQGVSLNTYIQRAVADAVRSAGRRARRATDTSDSRSSGSRTVDDDAD